MAAAYIEIKNLEKRYGPLAAVRDFSIDVTAGEFISVLGASGSGKTTVLRMIAGLEEPSRGRILIGGRDATALPPESRDIGLVFQDYALFPHMSVRDNVAFPLRMRGIARKPLDAAVDQILTLVGATHLDRRRPSQLSGGQQQRIALARALVFQPKLLLLDEPLSALDKNLREQMKAEIKTLHRRTGTTIIYVTHDQSEALALSDRIVVMHEGRILDVDRPDRLYSLPSSPYLAGFIGNANLIAGTVLSRNNDAIEINCVLGHLQLHTSQMSARCNPVTGDAVTIVVRPECVVVAPTGDTTGMLLTRCTIDEMLYNGAHTIYTLSARDVRLSLLAHCGLHAIGAFQTGVVVEVGVQLARSVVVSTETSTPIQ